MKKYIAVLVFLGLMMPVLAQENSEKEIKKHIEKVQKSKEKGKNVRSLDTLFASGIPYCLMKGTRKGLGGPTQYTVRALRAPDIEEIFLTMEAEGTGSTAVWYWDMVFVNQGQKIRFKNGTMDLENTIVDYNLFTDSSLNIVGMNKLVLLKGQPGVGVPAVPASTPKSGMVDRNRSGMIQIFGESIQQGGVKIGTLTKKTQAENGGVITSINIYFPNGELVAIAKNHGATDHEWDVVTAKNNESHPITSSLGKDEHDIVKYLVDSLYL